MIQAGRVVLASQSAARLALLRDAGLAVEARPAGVDEGAAKAAGRAAGDGPGEVALALAGTKAAAVGDAGGAVVIGADQMLACEGRWFDKPPDMAAARAQLQALRGRTHELHTAVVCHRNGTEAWRHLARPRLRMRRFSDAFLDAYLASEGAAVLGCVGAYRLEGPGVQLFEAVDGEHAAILGLPLLPLLEFLRGAGVLAD